MLTLFDVPIEVGQLQGPYASYCTEIDSAVLDSVRHAAPLTQTSSVSAGVSVSEAGARNLQLHQQKNRGVCEHAERELFAALSGFVPAEQKTRLARLEEVRKLELDIECILRGAAVLGYQSELPGDLAAAVSGSSLVARLDKSDRDRIAMILYADLEGRRSAWIKAKPAVDEAVSNTLRLQFQSPESGRDGNVADIADVRPEARNAIWEAEFKLLDELTTSATAGQLRTIRGAAVSALKIKFAPKGDPVPLPKGQPRSPASIEELAAVILSSGFADSAKAKARPVLKDWIQADQEIQVRQVRNRAAELDPGLSSIPAESNLPSTRAELGIGKLKELRDLLGAEWLAPGGQIPGSLTGRFVLSEGDANELGTPIAQKGAVPELQGQGALAVAIDLNTGGFLPKPVDISAFLASQIVDETTRTVIGQIATDAQAEWQRSVETQMISLKRALQTLAQAPSGARGLRRQAWESIVAAQGERAAAWDKASYISNKMLDDIHAALAGKPEPFRAELMASCLAADRASVIEGCSVLENLKGVTICPDAVQSGRNTRGTREEHALVCAAIEAQRSTSQLRMDAIRRKVIALMSDFEKAQAAQYPPDADQADNAQKMQLATTFATGMQAIHARANEITADWRRANEELLADAGKLLPTALADRWRRCWRLGSVEPIRAAYVRNALNYANVDSVQAKELAPALEVFIGPWESWAETVIDEAQRQAGAFANSNDKDATLAARRRAVFLALVLVPSLRDRVDAVRMSLALDNATKSN